MNKSQNHSRSLEIVEKENRELRSQVSALEKKLQDSISWRQTIMDSIPYPMFIKNSGHTWIDVNEAFCQLMKLPKEKLYGKSDFDFLSKEQAEIFWEKDSEVLVNDTINWNEEYLTRENEERKLLTAKVRIEDQDGNDYVLGIISDITDEKNSIALLQNKNDQINKQQKNIETLLKEVHHRVKNNLQIIHSLLGLQMELSGSDSTRSAFQDSRNRILAMASVHEMLYKANDFSIINLNPYLESFIKQLNKTFPGKGDREVVLEVDHLHVEPSMAISIGLIVNEIFTNSIKHGGGQNGRCEIYLHVRLKDNQVCFEMGDNGSGVQDLESLKKSVSLGYELVLLLTEQLDGVVEHPIKESGLHYSIQFQLNG
ncbi:MAG: sensor histidine kinase [Crocinitomicaceae bacterium]